MNLLRLVAVLVALTLGGCTGGRAGDSTASVASSTSVVSSASCEALVGPEPWLILSTETDPEASCVSVGVFQDLQIWNKGYEPMTVEWLGSRRRIPSDERFATGPIGESLEPGLYPIDATPYLAPDLLVVESQESFSAQTELTTTGFGPIEIGMTLAEASDASGKVLVIDRDLASECLLAVVENDPYSPLFIVEGTRERAITGVTTFYPSEKSVGADLTTSCAG
jgi:hypothetical protein